MLFIFLESYLSNPSSNIFQTLPVLEELYYVQGCQTMCVIQKQKGQLQGGKMPWVQVLTLTFHMLRLLDTKIFENHVNPVMLVFIGKLSPNLADESHMPGFQ